MTTRTHVMATAIALIVGGVILTAPVAHAEGKIDKDVDDDATKVVMRVDIEGQAASMVTLSEQGQTLLDASGWLCTARASGTGAALVCVQGGTHESATNVDCARAEQRVATLFVHQRVQGERVRVASFALLCQ